MDREKRYQTFEENEMILRDCLATDRTILANERTYLAYLRTGVSLLAAGIGLVKYLDDGLFSIVLGYIFIVGSIVTFIIGTNRFMKIKKPLKKIYYNEVGVKS